MRIAQTKQEFVRDTVREWIREGKFRPGEQLPPDGVLSKQFQLNCRTIAAGLNQLVEEELLERAPRKGTVVKRKISIPKSNAVALIAPDFGDVYSEMARSVNQGLMAKNLFPVFLDQKLIGLKDEIISFLERLTSHQRPYGFLAIGDLCYPYEYLKENPSKMENTVFLMRYHYPEQLPCAKYVLTDYDAMGNLAVRYFAGKGIRNLAFVPRKESQYCGVHSSVQVQIFQAMLKYAKDYGISVNESLFWRCHAGAEFMDIFPELMKESSRKPEGFFGMDADQVDLIFPVLRSFGIQPVRDCPILGYSNTFRAKQWKFDSFDIRPEETVEFALDLLMDKSGERQILVPPEIIHYSNENFARS